MLFALGLYEAKLVPWVEESETHLDYGYDGWDASDLSAINLSEEGAWVFSVLLRHCPSVIITELQL